MSGPRSWGASVGAIAGYLVAALVHQLPQFYFYPRSGEWSTAVLEGEPGIRWYGMMLYALAGGVIGVMVLPPLLRGRRAWNAVWIAALIAMLTLAIKEVHWLTGGH